MTTTKQHRARGTGSIQTKTTAAGDTRFYPVWRGVWYPAVESEEAAEQALENLISANRGGEGGAGDAPSPTSAGRPPIGGTVEVAGMRVHVVRYETFCRSNYLPSLDPVRYGRPAGILQRPGADSWNEERIGVIENVLIPCLGPMLTYQIQALDVLEVMQGRIEGYAPTREGSRCHDHVSIKRATNEVNVLSQTFQDMLIASCALHNPVTAARTYAHRLWHHDPRKRPALKPRELAGLVNCTQEHHQAMMDLLGAYGPRPGEVIALPIRNYDPEAGFITIDCSRSRGQVGPTKTGSSRRTIRVCEDMNRRLRRALQRARQVPNREQVLFPGSAGGYIDPSHWRESVFQPAVKRAVAQGLIPEEIGALLVPHALRHTAAHNMLLHQGKEMTQVMAILGHTSINITVSLYGHVKPITG